MPRWAAARSTCFTAPVSYTHLDVYKRQSEARQTSMQKTEEIRATLVNLFEGKIVCADCGKKMYFHRKRIDKDKRKRWYAYYECSTSVDVYKRQIFKATKLMSVPIARAICSDV